MDTEFIYLLKLLLLFQKILENLMKSFRFQRFLEYIFIINLG